MLLSTGPVRRTGVAAIAAIAVVSFPSLAPGVDDLGRETSRDLEHVSSTSPLVPTHHSGYVLLPPDAHVIDSLPTGVAIGDVTGDGLDDALVTTTSYGTRPLDYHLLLYPQLPDGTLGSFTALPLLDDVVGSVAVILADLDGSGILDVVVGHDQGITVFLSDGAGGLEDGVLVADLRAATLSSGHIDGDEHVDVVSMNGDTVSVFYGDGTGGFREIRLVTPDTGATLLDHDLADVTGDTYPDLVIQTSAYLHVHRHDGIDRFLVPGDRYSTIARQTHVACGDIDGDGRDDIVTQNHENGGPYILVWLQAADGSIDQAAGFSRPCIDLPGTVVVSDLDGNGAHDLVFAHDGYDYLSVFLNSGDNGELSVEEEDLYDITAPGSSFIFPHGLAAGDLNGDGCNDVAVAQPHSESLLVLYGEGCRSEAAVGPQSEPLCSIGGFAAGGHHSLALGTGGSVWAWGDNHRGQLGRGVLGGSDGNPSRVLDPDDPGGYLADVIAVAAGGRHNLALKADGSLWAWGDNGRGQLGTGTIGGASATPVRVVDPQGPGGWLADIESIAAGVEQSYAVIASDGSLRAWGGNEEGQLGNGTTDPSPVPVTVTGLTGVRSAAGGDLWALALLDDGSVYMLGNGELLPEPVHHYQDPTDWLVGVSALDAGSLYFLARKPDGRVVWRTEGYGPRYVEGPVSGDFTGAVSVAAGYIHGVIARDDGTVWTWGLNHLGQLGIPGLQKVSRTPPEQVPGLAEIVAVRAGFDSHNLALASDGTLWTWGANEYGQLGLGFTGSFVPEPTPIHMPEPSAVDLRPSAQPLLLSRGGGVTGASWEALGAEWNLYRGTLDSLASGVYDHQAVGGGCGLSSPGSALQESPGSFYFLVTAAGGPDPGCATTRESGTGRNSAGIRRPPAEPACP